MNHWSHELTWKKGATGDGKRGNWITRIWLKVQTKNQNMVITGIAYNKNKQRCKAEGRSLNEKKNLELNVANLWTIEWLKWTVKIKWQYNRLAEHCSNRVSWKLPAVTEAKRCDWVRVCVCFMDKLMPFIWIDVINVQTAYTDCVFKCVTRIT